MVAARRGERDPLERARTMKRVRAMQTWSAWKGAAAVTFGAVLVCLPPTTRALEEVTWEVLESIAAGLAGGTFDCNGNGVDDGTDFAQGKPDTDGDGLLDECEDVPGDFSGDRSVNAQDGTIISALVGFVEGIDREYRADADLDANHRIDTRDVDRWLTLAGLPICSDGVDNDHDRSVDAVDPDCDAGSRAAKAAAQMLPEVPDIPDLTGVVIRTVVTSVQHGLRFEYAVDNTRGSLPVFGFVFSLESDPSRAVVTIDGLDNSGDNFHSSAEYRSQLRGDSYVAVAFPIRGPWLPSFDPLRNAFWGAGTESWILPIGKTQSGLVLLTRALPGIRRARIEADVIDLLPSETELDADGLDVADLQMQVEASEQLLNVVAPVAPPAALDLPVFADEIETLRTMALAEGWIRSSGAAQSLQIRLAALRKALARPQQHAIATRLAAEFLSEVDSIACPAYPCPKGQALTPEAYALMRFNMEYLKSRIPPGVPYHTRW